MHFWTFTMAYFRRIPAGFAVKKHLEKKKIRANDDG